MDAYSALDYTRTLLEVQKLAYFLQVAGQPLRLRYEAGLYGPYADNVNKVLEAMEGHFIRGYGDRRAEACYQVRFEYRGETGRRSVGHAEPMRTSA